MVTRAAQATLVVVEGTGEGTELLDELLARYPARGILLSIPADRPRGDVEAWVSATCRRDPAGGGLLCSEVIHIEAGPGSDERLASGIRALAVGSLPVVVLAPTVDPLQLEWLALLAGEVEVVAVASGRRGWPGARPLWEHIASESSPRYADLLWVRLEDWRGALARWFDRPGEASRLGKLTGVRFVADGGDRDPAALLLAGWLGSRLGWSAGRADADSPRVAFAGATEQQGTPGTIREVGLEFEGKAEEELRFLRREDDPAILVVNGSGTEVARYRAGGIRPVDWAEAALHDHGLDEVGRDAYRFALTLAEAG